MKVRNAIAAICGIILIACMAAGLPAFAAETGVEYVDINGDGVIDEQEIAYAEALVTMQAFTEGVEYVDLDGDGEISDAEMQYAVALKAMNDYQARYDERAAAEAEAALAAVEEENDAEEAAPVAAAATTTSTWSGKKLSKSAGSVMGPSGKEVYYNLNMSKVVANAQRKGLQGSYWVRDDGVKMFGDYIIVAANYDVHPYGSTFEISLGTAIALDTGGFASSNPTMVDVAVTW